MPEEKHHKYSPSQLHRIMRCPGSVARCEQMPAEEESPYAAEGTLLHAHMAEAMDLWPEPYVPDTENPEHRQLILECLEHISDIIGGLTVPWSMLNDCKVYMADVDCEGTLDLCLYDANNLHVIDFKFGGGVEVSPVDNEQLMAYAQGALRALMSMHRRPPNIMLHIMQPRLNNFSGYAPGDEEMEQFRVDLRDTIARINIGIAPIVPGEKQCKWCLARGVCKERLEQLHNNAVVALSSVTDTPTAAWKMSIEDLAKILATKQSVATAFGNIEQYLKREMLAGTKVPGFKLVTGRSSRAWKDDADAFSVAEAVNAGRTKAFLDEMTLMETKLKSPAQVEKLLDKKGKEALKACYNIIEGALSMAADSNNKPAIPSAAAHSFREVIDCEAD